MNWRCVISLPPFGAAPTPDATSTVKGKHKLTGDLGGTASSPTVVAFESATTSVNVAAATAPTTGQVLTATGASAATWQTAAGGGQTLVTKVVAASGGDYTTLGAAIAAASSGWVIAVQPGTYAESTITSATTNLSIFGTGPEQCIISLGANVMTLSGTQVHIEGVQITSTTGGAILSGTYAEVINCHLYRTAGSATNHLLSASGAQAFLKGNSFFQTTATNAKVVLLLSATKAKVIANYFELALGANSTSYGLSSTAGGTNAIIANNEFNVTALSATDVVNLAGPNSVFTGNHINDTGGNTCLNLSGASVVVSGNNLLSSTGTCIIFGAGALQFFATISGNYIQSNGVGNIGISATGGDSMITGNMMQSGTKTSSVGIKFLNSANRDNVCITGNRINNYVTGVSILGANVNNTLVVGNNTQNCTTGINDLGTTSTVASNN